jgi:hypothetical protein
MWICPKCAAHNDDEAHICPVCGTRLLSAASGGSVPEYPVPVDPWASQADTQTVMSPFHHAPGSGAPAPPTSAPPSSGGPTSGGPASGGPASGGLTSGGPAFVRPTSTPPGPAPTRPFVGAIVPAPQPPTQSVTQYPMRPATIEVTQRTGIPLRWVITIAAVFVAGVGVAAAIVIPKLLADDNGGGSPSPTSATGPSSAPSSADPEEGGLVVAIAPHITGGRADEVVAMLDVYFNGINAKDYPAVGTVLDPDGTTDPDDEDDMKELADGTRSTKDSQVTLTSLDDAGDKLLSAEVTFRSNQKTGDGPEDRPAETCTQWDIVYTLSHDGAYRIRESDASSQPC